MRPARLRPTAPNATDAILVGDPGRALMLAHSIPGRVRAGRFEPCAANSCEWKDYWPGGLALVRIQQMLAKGVCRFDG